MSDAPAIGIDLGTTYRQVLLLTHCVIFTLQVAGVYVVVYGMAAGLLDGVLTSFG